MTAPALTNARQRGATAVHSLAQDGSTLCGLEAPVWLSTSERTTCEGCRAAALEMLAVLLAPGEDSSAQDVDTSPPCL